MRDDAFWRALDALHEAHVEPCRDARVPQFVGEIVDAERARAGGRQAEPRDATRHVPARAAGTRKPLRGARAHEIGEDIARRNEDGQFVGHVAHFACSEETAAAVEPSASACVSTS